MKQFACWLFMASLFAGAASIAGEKRLLVAPGDILTKQQPLGGWSTVKILLVDTWPDGSKAAHVLTYEDSAAKPDAALVPKLGVRVWHAPIDAASSAERSYRGSRRSGSGNGRRVLSTRHEQVGRDARHDYGAVCRNHHLFLAEV